VGTPAIYLQEIQAEAFSGIENRAMQAFSSAKVHEPLTEAP
jgi:hypothetical protein